MFIGRISYLSVGEAGEGIVKGELSLRKGWRMGRVLVCGIHRQEQRKKAFQGLRTGQLKAKG